MPVYEETIKLNDQVSAPAKKASDSVKGLADQMTGLQGETSGLSSVFAELGGPLGMVVAGVGAAALAFGGLVVAGASLALEQNQLRNQLLATFSALGGGPAAGKATLGMLDELSDKLPQSREQLAGWTKQFMALGVTGTEQLTRLNTAAASAQAIMGDPSAADAFTNLEKKIRLAAESGQALKIPVKGLGSLAETGLTVNDIAAKMGVSAKTLGAQLKAGSVDATKFGNALQDALIEKGKGPLDKMGASFTTQLTKLKENFFKLFEGIDPGPFLDAMKDLLGVFSQMNPSGQALKAGIGGFFNGLFSIASKVLPVIKQIFLQLVIWGLKAYIAAKPLVAKFKEWLPVLAPIWTALKTIGVVVGTIAAVAVASVASIVAAFTALGGVVLWLTGKAIELGSEFVDGLVNGIKSGATAVVDAVKGLASGAVDAFKGALGIHSPSKVMMQLGAHASTGAAQGIAGGAPDVHAASGDLAKATQKGFTGGGGAAAGGSSGGVTVNVQPGAIQIDGAGKSASDITEEMISLIFERVALAQGLA